MRLLIHCPNCFGEIKKINLNTEPMELTCNNCSCLFTISIFESGERTNRKHDDLLLNLSIISEKINAKDLNENLDPIWHCVFCSSKINQKITKNANEDIKCNDCGATYVLQIEP